MDPFTAAVVGGIVLLLGGFSGGLGIGLSVKRGGEDSADVAAEVRGAVEAGVAPLLAARENEATLIDPARTPFCREESKHFDANRCVLIEVCDAAEGSDTEVTRYCQDMAAAVVQEWKVRHCTEFADASMAMPLPPFKTWKEAYQFAEDSWEKGT